MVFLPCVVPAITRNQVPWFRETSLRYRGFSAFAQRVPPADTFTQVSLRPTVRLNTSRPGAETP